ncbi:MAG TPA: hypothetical protein VMW52_01295 [Phycisphaerae bacterium]|nr:hypothetical protein [Phycisphaerae bacterium]
MTRILCVAVMLVVSACYAGGFAEYLESDGGLDTTLEVEIDQLFQCDIICGNYLPCWPQDPYGDRWKQCMANCEEALPYTPPEAVTCLVECDAGETCQPWLDCLDDCGEQYQ